MWLFPSGRVKRKENCVLTELLSSLQDNERGLIAVAINTM